jgi:hypothetical protein
MSAYDDGACEPVEGHPQVATSGLTRSEFLLDGL